MRRIDCGLKDAAKDVDPRAIMRPEIMQPAERA
jgi:hypothetical protein